MKSTRLSIVVPVGPEDRLEAGLRQILEGVPADCEVIVSVAESAADDGLPGSIRVAGEPGRGRQLNRGVAAASGDWIWLLHADSRVEDDAPLAVSRFMESQGPALGYGRLRFLDDGPWLTRLNAMGAAIRCRWLRLPYGDQGLCLPIDWFRRLKGFREDLVRGEDLDFVVRAREAGLPIRPMPVTVWTSARRYREHGWLKTTWAHQVASIALVRNASRSARADRP